MWASALLILGLRPFRLTPYDALFFVDVPHGSSHSRSFFRLALLGGILFVGLSCSAGGEVEELRSENEQLRQKLEAAQEEASSLQRGQTVEVLSTDVYFKSGSAELSPEGVDELETVAERIRSDFSDRTIRIEGYTDARPIGAPLEDTYPSNWELSAARAARVARHFRWTHDMDPARFEVVGFGSQHPVATNETAEGRRKNRRVRVAVLRRPPTSGGQDASATATSRR
jgi:chemotaxis protein MotB